MTYLSCLPGAHVPLTKEGNIIADGVLASCYTSFNHDLTNTAMVPVKWFPEIMEWIFGLNNGLPDYSDITKYLGNWLLPADLLYK